MAFNLMEIMNASSQGAAMKYEPAEIDIENICANPANDIYNTEDIDKLAEAIELAGRVLQNLVVKEVNGEGHYMIISGHRRWLACQKLVAGGNEQYRKMPCLIEHERDDLLQELMLIYSNSTIRVLTDAEKMRQASRATAICKQLKEENKLEGRVRDIVAGMLNESAAQLARYSAIDKNLVNEDLRQKFDEGALGVSAAYEASKLSEEGQQKIADKLHETGNVSLQDVKKVKEHTEYLNTLYPIWITMVESGAGYKCSVGYNDPERKLDIVNPIGFHPDFESAKNKAVELLYYNSSEEIVADLLENGYISDMPERYRKDAKQEEEPEAETEMSKVEAARAKMAREGYEALTDCEKCKITTCCEDCCRTCPPEKHCNVRQCQIENRTEAERIAKAQTEHNAKVTEHALQKPEMRPRSELLQVAISEVEKRLEKLSDTAAAMAKLNEEEQKEEEAIIEKMKVDYYSRLLGLIRQEKTTIG